MTMVDPSRRRRAAKAVAAAEQEYCQCERRAVTLFAKLCATKRDLAQASVDEIDAALVRHRSDDPTAAAVTGELIRLLRTVIERFSKIDELAATWRAAGDDNFANFILRAGDMLKPACEAEAQIARLYGAILAGSAVLWRRH